MYAPIRRFFKKKSLPTVILYDSFCFDENGNVIDPTSRYPFHNITEYLNQIETGEYRPTRLEKAPCAPVEIANVSYIVYYKSEYDGQNGYYTDHGEYVLIRENLQFTESMKASVDSITTLEAILIGADDNVIYSDLQNHRCSFIVDFYNEKWIYVENNWLVAPTTLGTPVFNTMSDYLAQCKELTYRPYRLVYKSSAEINGVLYDIYHTKYFTNPNYQPVGYRISGDYFTMIPASFTFTPEKQAIVSGEKTLLQGLYGHPDSSWNYTLQDKHRWFIVAYEM